MWPTIVEIETASGPTGIRTYGLMLVLAFSAAFAIIHFRAQRAGVDPDRLVGGYVAAAVGGMLGARILYSLALDPLEVLTNPLSLFSLAGFAVYGGILGGIAGVAVFVFSARLPPWSVADLAAPGVVLGMGVGRLGCFFAGCCNGAVAPTPAAPTSLTGGLFPAGQVLVSSTAPFVTHEYYAHGGSVASLKDLPLYPTQLWAVVGLLSLAGFLAWQWTRRRFDGQVAAYALVLEPPMRILFESFRADSRGYVASWPASPELVAWLPPGFSQAGADLATHGTRVGVTTSQGIGLAMMAAGAAIWVVRRRTTTATAAAPTRPADSDLVEDLT